MNINDNNLPNKYHGHWETRQKGNTTMRVFIPPEIEEIRDRLSRIEEVIATSAAFRKEISEALGMEPDDSSEDIIEWAKELRSFRQEKLS